MFFLNYVVSKLFGEKILFLPPLLVPIFCSLLLTVFCYFGLFTPFSSSIFNWPNTYKSSDSAANSFCQQPFRPFCQKLNSIVYISICFVFIFARSKLFLNISSIKNKDFLYLSFKSLYFKLCLNLKCVCFLINRDFLIYRLY